MYIGVVSFFRSTTTALVRHAVQSKDMSQRDNSGDRAHQALGNIASNRLTWSQEDAELLASRKLSDESVARLFGISPTSVGITDKATYINVEQESAMLVRNALAPRARSLRWRCACRLPAHAAGSVRSGITVGARADASSL